MTLKREPLLIHGFAALHAAVTVLCAVAGIRDALVLTLLTLTMSVLLCIGRAVALDMTAIVLILVNVGGFILGTLGADFFGIFLSSPLAVHALSTFFTTEVLGWSIVLFSKNVKLKDKRMGARPILVVSLAVTIYLVRILIDIVVETRLFMEVGVVESLQAFFSNSVVLLLMIAATVFSLNKIGNTSNIAVPVTVTILVISALAALLESYGIPFHFSPSPGWNLYLRMLVVAFLTEVTLFALIYVISAAVRMRNEVEKEKERTHQAEFRYMTLKHQVNPHFLFNSLNILDSLILDGETSEARDFIRRLSGIYRYMLRHENAALVRVEEELEFAEMYFRLLQVRFPEGLEIHVDIPEEVRSRFVIPCTLQLLIENATKHNAIDKSNPLIISILSTQKETLAVENALIPKITPVFSTGLGMKYIRQQYLDAAGQDIRVEKTAEKFRVEIPLL